MDLIGYIDKIHSLFNQISGKFSKINLPSEIQIFINNSTTDAINALSNLGKNFLTGLLGFITSIPTIAIYFVITILALFLICVDKIYILDQIEHHFPKKWVTKIGTHLKDLSKTLGGYLKAEATLIGLSFSICLVGLYVLKFFKFNIEFPLLIALGIGFVDALPILGSGTIMVPWAIISGINGDLKLGVAIIILLVIMAGTRQFLEPKLVSKHIGTHPIFTLIAMYTGFKIIGVLGMLIGPIILIIIKNVFATLIDDGIVKSLLDKK